MNDWTIKSAGLGYSVFSETGVFLAWYYTEKECQNMIKRWKNHHAAMNARIENGA